METPKECLKSRNTDIMSVSEINLLGNISKNEEEKNLVWVLHHIFSLYLKIPVSWLTLEIWIAPWVTWPSHTSFVPHASKNWSSTNTEWRNFLISHLWIYKANTGKWCLNKPTATSGTWPSNISHLNSFIRCGRKDRKGEKNLDTCHLSLDKIYGSALLAAVWIYI